MPVGGGNCVALCDLRIFVDEAAEPVSPLNTHSGRFHGWMGAPGGRVLQQRPVRPMVVVMIDILAEDHPQVPYPGDQHPVQALAAGAADPAFRYSVRAGRLDGRLDDPHAGRGEDRVECGGELGVSVPDQELQAVTPLLQAHEQAVAIRSGRICWVGSDRDADGFARKATEVIDAAGRLVLPGFIDSHNHVRLGSDEDCVQLAGAAALREVQSRITVWLAEHPDAAWVEAEGLDFPNPRPVAGDLDGVTAGRPAFVFDYTGHGVLVNHAAMPLLGVTRGGGPRPVRCRGEGSGHG